MELQDISLRPLQAQDAPVLLAWLTDPRVLAYYDGRDVQYMPDTLWQKYSVWKEGAEAFVWQYKGQAVGYMQVYAVDEEGQKAYAYIAQPGEKVFAADQFLGVPELWGRGLGRRFMACALAYLQDAKGADTVLVDPHATNLRAIGCYAACGFRKEKLLPAHELHEGELRDCVLMVWKKENTVLP